MLLINDEIFDGTWGHVYRPIDDQVAECEDPVVELTDNVSVMDPIRERIYYRLLDRLADNTHFAVYYTIEDRIKVNH